MLNRSFICTFVFSLILVCGTCAQNQPDYISAFMLANRPAMRGAPYVIDKKNSRLGGGDLPMEIVLYSYAVAEGGDANQPQYLAIFELKASGRRASRWVLVGLKGSQLFDKIQVEGETIVLSGKKWLERDPLCCPSQSAKVRYLFLEGELVPAAD